MNHQYPYLLKVDFNIFVERYVWLALRSFNPMDVK